MTDDFKEGYKAAISYIRHCSSMLRLQYPDEPKKRKRLSDAYYDLIDELVAHLAYNEELDKEERDGVNV